MLRRNNAKKYNNLNAGRLATVLLAFLLIAGTALSTSRFGMMRVDAADRNVSSWADLVAAVASAEDGDTITVTANLGATGSITLSEEKNITIKGDDVGIYRDYSGTTLSNIESLFKVEKGTLTLGQGLTLSGKVLRSDAGHEGQVDNWNYRKGHIKSGTRGFFVEVGTDGKLLIDGANISGYMTAASTADNRDNLPTGISPIYVKGGFEMNNGSITGNHVSAVIKDTFINNCKNNGAQANGYINNHGVLKHGVNSYGNVKWLSGDGADNGAEKLGAGAVYFDGANATYSISGGTISDNHGNAGAIIVNKGTLDIKGSTEIADNFGDHTSTIFVASDDATVRMCGGTLQDNFGTMGGGVLAGDNGKFFLMGGTIDNNYTPTSGGGILIYSNNVFLLSGKITNNKSAIFGGGIYVYGNDDDAARSQSYTTVISKADIKRNKAVYTPDLEADDHAQAEGIETADSRQITISGEEAFQRGSGGGIWLCPAGIAVFDATSVNLSDNTADRQNADFHKDAGFKGGLLIDFGPHERLGDFAHDEYSSGRTGGVPFTYEEATSGMSEMFGIVNTKKVDHNPDTWVEITGNASRRGGGVGSNGTVLFMTPGHDDVNMDSGTLNYKKEFVDMDEEPMEYDMILADSKGNPILNDNKEEIRIATFRLFDSTYASTYEDQRKTKGSSIYGQGEAKWSDDYSEIEITFPKGNDDANFFTTDDPDNSELYIVMREYRINPDNTRGTQVSEQIFRTEQPKHTVTIEKDPQEITYYPNYVPCASGQGCDSCDPGEPNTFNVVSRDFNFDASGENKEVPEIEKYVNEAVHSDIKVDDEFTYNILAYVATDADEMIITDELNDQLEFASSAKDVKVYDLGMTTDRGEGLEIPVMSNHLPVYDVSGNPINNGGKTPSVKTGTAIEIKNNDFSKIEINGSTLEVRIANKLEKNAQGEYINAETDQELTPLRGHYVRVEFKARLAKSVRQKINKSNTDEGLAYETIMDDREYKDGIHGERGTPYTGNDPVKSDENHTGIANTASYEMKVKNTAKYQDTSNTVTVKPEVPEKPEIEKYVNKAVHKDVDYEEVFTYDIIAFVTRDADYVHISDILSDVLEYVSKSSEVKVADLGEDVNHKVANDIYAEQVNADASVAAKGIAIKDARVSINGKELTVDIPKAAKYRGHWIRVSFDARIIPSSLQSDILKAYDDVYADLVYKDSVTKGKRSMDNVGNAPVISDEDHDGIPNTASYMIKVGGLYKYGDTSNTVTVKPTDINDYVLDESEDKKDEESKIKGADTGDDAPLGFALAGLLGSALAIELMRRRRMS